MATIVERQGSCIAAVGHAAVAKPARADCSHPISLAKAGFRCQSVGEGGSDMSPEQLSPPLTGGRLAREFPASAFDHHYLTTADEAFAVVRALTHGDLYSSTGVLTEAQLFNIVALIQKTFTPSVDDIFRREACPLLRKLVIKGLSEDFNGPRVSADQIEVWALKQHAESYLFALKALTFYGHREDRHRHCQCGSCLRFRRSLYVVFNL